MQSMIEASTFRNGFGPPPLPAPFAEPPILPQAPPSAAGVSTSHLPAIMDGSVGPNTDGSTSAAAHNVDGVTTKPPENAPLTAAQLREKAAKARVSFSFTTLTNGAVTTAPKHACKMPHCYPDHVSPRKAAAAKKPASKPAATKKAASKPAATKKAASKPAATKKEATKKRKSVSPPEHN